MIGFRQVQDILDRALGEGPLPNHGAFWRGKTRDDFVEDEVWGVKLINIGNPDHSGLVHALRGRAPFGSDLTPRPDGAIYRRMPGGRAPATEEDIRAIEEWVGGGCPETSPVAALANALPVGDDVHIRFWRSMDDFFLPSMATPETRSHVNRMHGAALAIWLPEHIHGQNVGSWSTYLSSQEVRKSFVYVRHHQRRFIREYYNNSQDDIFDSLYKFGGNLLPLDPNSNVFPEHTMNGPRDWFFWIPYLDATLAANDTEEVDLNLARGWQIGIIADALLRANERGRQSLVITDFQANDPNLKAVLISTYGHADAATLKAEMIRRTQDSGLL